MTWRRIVVGAYAALAVVVGVAYGGNGLAVLFSFYVWAGAWVVFFVVGGRLARDAGRGYVRRLETPRPERRPGGSGLSGGDPRPVEDAVPEPVPRRRPVPAH